MPQSLPSLRSLLTASVVALIWGWLWFQGPPGADAGEGSSITDVLRSGEIEVHGTTLGSPSAPVTVVEFIDLRCGGSANFHRDELPKIVEEVVKPGKAKVTLVAIVAHDERSRIGQYMFVRLAQQDQAWAFADEVFSTVKGPENTRSMNDAYLSSTLAKIPGLNPRDVERFWDDPTVRRTATADDELARNLGIDDTPDIAVGPSNVDLSGYRRVEGRCSDEPDADDVIDAVDEELARLM